MHARKAGHIMQQAPSGAVPTVHQTISPTFQEAQVATQPEAVVTMATTQIIAGSGEIQFANAQALAQFEADKRAVYRSRSFLDAIRQRDAFLRAYTSHAGWESEKFPVDTLSMVGQCSAGLEWGQVRPKMHPLFPLLALLFEKCELATQSADYSSSESFDVDIQAFVQHQEQDRKPFFSDDLEVDGLMVKAIQVLRIHLLELEKVQELCKDFCTRYITCLKSKMQSENLLRSDYPSYNNSSPSSDSDSRNSSSSHSIPAQPIQQVQVVNSAGTVNNVVIQPGVQPAVSMSTLQPGQIVSGGTVYQMVQTAQGIVAQPIQLQTTPVQAVAAPPHAIHGSTPLSQIGTTPLPHERVILPAEPSTPTSQDEDDDVVGKKKQKRGVLPKHATSIMRSWLFQHIVHPYPTEDEKRHIAAQTNLTLLQVNNWFINARRRILQPMLDASNPDSSHKAKKAKTQSQSCRPVQRFWPESIANLQPQIPHNSSKSDTDDKSVSSDLENDISSTTEHHIDGSLSIESQNGDLEHEEQDDEDLSPPNSNVNSESGLPLGCDTDSSSMED